MSETKQNNSFFDTDGLLRAVREIVREEISAANNTGKKMLTAEQLAAALQVNRATVYAWVRTKSIPYFESGSHLRFDLQDVLDHQRRNPKP